MPTTALPTSTPKLTIGFPVFDDHQGLLFTIEALRMYQDLAGCEVLIVDNNPNGPDGKDNRGLVESMNSPDTPFRYVAAGDNIGPSVTKGCVFTEAAGEWVLCMDAHELLPFGTIPRLLKWFNSNPECRDLLTGPLLSNQLFPIATHFSNKWSGEMWGTWSLAWACTCGEMLECRELKIEGGATPAPPVCSFYNMIRQEQDVVCRRCGKPYPAIPWSNHEPRMAEHGYKPVGFDPNTPPFEIPAMGMGLFACRRDSWLGFAKGVYGFGAEEWCIHERYRQAGHKTLCLPFLRWWHRFARKAAPYPALRHHKVRNYVLEFCELGLDPTPIYQHFVTDLKVYQQAEWDRLIKDPMGARDPAAAPCTTCGGGAPATALVNGQLQQPPGEAQDIEALYEWAIKTPRDLDQHLPKLRELAAGCEHVTEITKRRESTIGLLAGRPKTMISWQQEQDPLNGRVHAAVAATVDDASTGARHYQNYVRSPDDETTYARIAKGNADQIALLIPAPDAHARWVSEAILPRLTASRRKGALTQAQAKRLAASAIRICREIQDNNGISRKSRGTPLDRQVQDCGIVAMFQRGELVGVGPERTPMMVLSVSRAKGILVVAPQDNLEATEQVEPCDVFKDPLSGVWPDELGG